MVKNRKVYKHFLIKNSMEKPTETEYSQAKRIVDKVEWHMKEYGEELPINLKRHILEEKGCKILDNRPISECSDTRISAFFWGQIYLPSKELVRTYESQQEMPKDDESDGNGQKEKAAAISKMEILETCKSQEKNSLEHEIRLQQPTDSIHVVDLRKYPTRHYANLMKINEIYKRLKA